MNGDGFLQALGETFVGPSIAALVLKADTSDKWTKFMTARLLALADSRGLHVCAKNLGIRPTDGAEDRHMGREFLFDFTMYSDHDWTDWGLPCVIVEHENYWSQAAFFQDFWKLLVANAPLRVMFGYAATPDGVEALASVLIAHATTSGWRYPPGVEDLVLLRCREMGWPRWRVVRRRPGSEAWEDLGALLVSNAGQ